jgi:hypothetical protein
MNKLVTVKTCTCFSEIVLPQSLLESKGIQCFVKDEIMAQVNPLYSNTIGGIKLQVRQSGVESILKILKQGGYIEEKEDQPSSSYIKLNKILSKIFKR